MILMFKKLMLRLFPRTSKFLKRNVLIPLSAKNSESIFTRIYHKNYWSDSESRSGAGSNLIATEKIRESLPELIRQLGIKKFLDAPCGDFHWMKLVDLKLEQYIGADIVLPIINENKKRYEQPGRSFVQLNIVTQPLPEADILFCRDCLIHLSFDQIRKIVMNLKDCGIQYFAATSQPLITVNRDISAGEWRPLNLLLSPFNFPAPVLILDDYREGFYEQDFGKVLCVWKVADLDSAFSANNK